MRSHGYKAHRDSRSQLSNDFLRLEKLHAWDGPRDWVAKAFLGACELTLQADPSVAEAGGGSKRLAERLARRGWESETNPGEPGIAHHSAQSYSNTKRQDNQSF